MSTSQGFGENAVYVLLVAIIVGAIFNAVPSAFSWTFRTQMWAVILLLFPLGVYPLWKFISE